MVRDEQHEEQVGDRDQVDHGSWLETLTKTQLVVYDTGRGFESWLLNFPTGVFSLHLFGRPSEKPSILASGPGPHPCGWRPHETTYRLKNRHRLRILAAGLQWTSGLSGLLIKGSQ